MGDPVDDELRRTARRFTGASAPDADTGAGGGLAEVRARSAKRRRTRRAVTSGLGAFIALALAAGAMNLRSPNTESIEQGNGDRPRVSVDETPEPGTTAPGSPTTSAAPDSPPSSSAAGTTVPSVPGAAVPAGPGPATTTPSPSPTAGPPPGRIKPLHADMNGLGTANFGDDAEAAITALSTAFSKQPDRRTPISGGNCGIKAKLDVAWGDVTVTMLDKGDGLRVAAYHWGNLNTRNATADHPRPNPARPELYNAWGLFVGQTTFPAGATQLITSVARDVPDAALITAPGIADPAVVGSANGKRLNIGLHPVNDGLVIERIWVFDPTEVNC
jgi:hypothetical protein